MHLQKNKKVILYLILFILLGTLTNKSLEKIKFSDIYQINIDGLDFNQSKTLLESLNYLKFQNLFFLDNLKIHNLITANDLVDNYTVFKKYPSTLNIKIKKAKFLARVNKNGKQLFLGSNGKLISSQNNNKKLPLIFGDFKFQDFLFLKKIVDNSNMRYSEIKNLFFFPSGRWDIETQSGILIRLPKEKMKESLNLSVNFLINNEFKDIKIIDTRVSDQVIIND